MKTVNFHTLGCKVNAYETEGMKALFEQSGYQITDRDDADVFVINTCTVTEVGNKKSRQMIRRVKRHKPDAIVVVVGCYAQVYPEQVRQIPDVDILLGTTGRKDVVRAVERFRGNRIDQVNPHISAEYEDFPTTSHSRTRATLKIQDGCSRYCSYCIIPYARGPVRSRTVHSAVDEVARLVKQGFTEFVLVGIHLGSYGQDLGNSLIDIVSAVCHVPGVKRVRLGSLEPTLLTDSFVQQLACLPHICPSFHVSMQSGCEQTLRRMNRRYTPEQFLQGIGRLRSAMPNCGITTDVIVGFPGETEEEFEQSLQTVEQAAFSQLHVFPYSKREGTPAATMDGQVEKKVKEQRAARMIALGKRLQQDYLNTLLGTEQQVLFEQQRSDGLWEGLTPSYVRVLAQGDNLDGEYRTVSITACGDDHCKGDIL